MSLVPAFLLRRLYVKGSLKNTEEGWSFSLKNSLGSGYARKMLPLTLNGEYLPMESTFFSKDGEDVSFDKVSDDNTFGLPMNREISITVRGTRLNPAVHEIGIKFEVPGFNEMGFTFKDQIVDD